MSTSILIAKLLAAFYLSVSLGFIFNMKYYKKELHKIAEEPGTLYLGGAMALTAGLLIVTYHNTWVSNWTVLITLFGWLALVKGVLILTFPNTVKFFRPLYQGNNLAVIRVLTLVLGLLFGYYGFVA